MVRKNAVVPWKSRRSGMGKLFSQGRKNNLGRDWGKGWEFLQRFLFLSDQKEDVVVSLRLFVGPYCGKDDTWVPERRLSKGKDWNTVDRDLQGGGGSRLLLTVKNRVCCEQIPEQRAGTAVGIIPVMSFLPRALVCPGRKTIFCVVCKASD